MGWFWADEASAPVATPAKIRTDTSPPPGCPMHKKPSVPKPAAPPSTESSCPYTPPDRTSPSGSTPLSSMPIPPTPSEPEQKTSSLSKLNPLNWMPYHLSSERAPNQTVALPINRETSSIPKGDPGTGNWEYPSPQQMYNAMLRKGFTDTPADAVESMVAVHNFLNEGAWDEILDWERRFARGWLPGVQQCFRGGAAISEELWDENKDGAVPRLTRFMGRPEDLTPKAQMMQWASQVAPGQFSGEAPFDRHDWFITREMKDGTTKEVRYVIDYYEGAPEENGMPVFFLDVRPAVDTPSAAVMRMMRWSGDVWWKASGGEARLNATKNEKEVD
ncbi:hypothetical protein P152DRAFT_396295 [Eremomyces bilateralis CBS 781.70]|uniref:Holocytochrome c-type synthase n=1 Tax=Eremomyces bilateralis CBS 781.70 TaxID=1392243 RepID=A0A6G1G4Q0_9PEZI|nr:uncharacterized protein P152DRAFT_396295 [Eremomyces bilateralis CBS 781.70]KAF1812890.1 hypothetical protein P152DRAFT_396295 [Eremomyces bilateralis CBS 781.70]